MLLLQLLTLEVATSPFLSRHPFYPLAVLTCCSGCRDIGSLVATSLHVCYSLQLLVMMSRHQFSCRDLFSWHYTFEQASLDVMTSAQGFGIVPLLVVMSRHRFSCRDIILCCCRLHWLLLMSRLQLPCRDINLFNFCSFFSCFCLASCHELHQLPFNLHDVLNS